MIPTGPQYHPREYLSFSLDVSNIVLRAVNSVLALLWTRLANPACQATQRLIKDDFNGDASNRRQPATTEASSAYYVTRLENKTQ